MYVFIITDDTYRQRPSLAFLSREEAVVAARSAHGLSDAGAEGRILAVPLLFSTPPANTTLASIGVQQSLAAGKALSGEDSTTD